MTDYFALVGVPRRPVLDADAFHGRYLDLAARWHPDSGTGDLENFRELQEARKVFSDPAACLGHLLALEGRLSGTVATPVEPDLFLEVADALRCAKAVHLRLGTARSAIGRAACEPDRRRAEDRLVELAERVAARREEVLIRLDREDERWPECDFANLDDIRRSLVFLARWTAELDESLFLMRNPPGR